MDGSSPSVGRICVYVDPRYPPYAGLIRQVIVSADASGIELSAARCCMEALSEFGITEGEDCQAALVLGGDGTILRGLKYRTPRLSCLCRHEGHLGNARLAFFGKLSYRALPPAQRRNLLRTDSHRYERFLHQPLHSGRHTAFRSFPGPGSGCVNCW